MNRRSLRKLGVLASALTLAACATTPDRPTSELAMAKATVEQAQTNGAQQYSPHHLNTAREKLATAQTLAEEGENERAARLAREAEADAQLAAAEAQLEKDREALAEVEENLATLQRELERKQRQQSY